jgi:RHS repeat-associated protein
VPAAGQAQQRYGWLGGKQRSADALGGVILMGVRLYSPALGRFLQVDPVPGGNATAYDYCAGDPVNCTDLDGNWGWSSFKKALHAVATVASYASMIPGPIGTIAGVVSAVAYVATGDWKEAAWAIAGAAAAVVGAGAAVKAAKVAVAAVRAASRAERFGAWAVKAGRAVKSVVSRACNSFAPDTPVLMADGSYLPISDIQDGDQVTAVDPQTGERTSRPVLDVIVGQGDKHLVDIDLGGDGGNVLTATAEHPIWVVGKGWTFARDLRAGDQVVTGNGGRARVRGVTDRGQVHGQTVHNLNVGDAHTYVVGVDGTDLVVHNASCSVLPGKFARAPRARGVYVIKYNNGEYYIGKSRNMHRRMHQHFHSGKLNGAVDVRFIGRPRGSLRKLKQGTINRFKCYGGATLRNRYRASRTYAHC